MNTTLDEKRGLIHTAFRDLLGEEQAGRAVAFWDTWNPAKQASFTPLRFMQAAQSELNLSTDLKRQLIQYMISYKVSDERAQSLEARAERPSTQNVQSAKDTKTNVAPSIESEQYIVFYRAALSFAHPFAPFRAAIFRNPQPQSET